jgi:hypothetical protein
MVPHTPEAGSDMDREVQHTDYGGSRPMFAWSLPVGSRSGSNVVDTSLGLRNLMFYAGGGYGG